MARLPILEPEDVTGPRDAIRCKPYHAVLLAQTCVARQDAAVVQTTQDNRKPMGDRLNGDYQSCLRCRVGSAIRDRLPPEEPKPEEPSS